MQPVDRHRKKRGGLIVKTDTVEYKKADGYVGWNLARPLTYLYSRTNCAASHSRQSVALRRQRSEVRIFSGAPRFQRLSRNCPRADHRGGSITEARERKHLDGLSHV